MPARRAGFGSMGVDCDVRLAVICRSPDQGGNLNALRKMEIASTILVNLTYIKRGSHMEGHLLGGSGSRQ
jgi:hypothetical protein